MAGGKYDIDIFAQITFKKESLFCRCPFDGGSFYLYISSAQVDEFTAPVKERLTVCMGKNEEGYLQMTFILPDEPILDNIATSLSQIISAGKQ